MTFISQLPERPKAHWNGCHKKAKRQKKTCLKNTKSKNKIYENSLGPKTDVTIVTSVTMKLRK